MPTVGGAQKGAPEGQGAGNEESGVSRAVVLNTPAMMQAWADYLDGLASGAEVMPIGAVKQTA